MRTGVVYLRRRYLQVLNPVQTAVFCVKTWPIVPDIVAVGSVAESQLQAQWLHVHGSGQLASQQPWEHVQHMDWLVPDAGRLPEPASTAYASPAMQVLPADLLHGQAPRDLATAAFPCTSTATSFMNASSAAGTRLEFQHVCPIDADGQGRVVNKSAALTCACELQLPSASLPSDRGSEHQASSLAGSALPPWYMRAYIQDEMPSQDTPGPADAPQSTAADASALKLCPEVHPSGGILEPIHADPQQTGMNVGQASSGMTTTSRSAARTALESIGLLDLDHDILLSLMPR